MPHPFKPDPKLFVLFPSSLFTKFCNDLIRAEANRIGLPPSLIDDTVRETVPDGGIDCRISAPKKPPTKGVGNWIPDDGGGWQYKSGKCPSANDLSSKEFGKPEVEKTVRNGQTYCFLIADSITPKKANKIRAEFIAFYKKKGYSNPKIRIYHATQFSEWALEHPALLVQYLNYPISGWQPFEQWKQCFRNEFFPDEGRINLTKEIQQRLEVGDGIVLVLGAAGVGKTRLVLEAVRPDGFNQRVLYFGDAAKLSSDFFWYLQKSAPQSSPILIIDECTAEQYQRIKALASNMPPSTSIIAIGPIEYDATREFLQLRSLSIDQLAKIVESFSPEMHEPERLAIAARCGGSPKLVVFVAEAIAQGKGNIKSWKDLEESVDLAYFINERLFPIKDPEPTAKVMRAISLFTRLGWEDEVANEGTIALNYFDIEEKHGRLVAGRLFEMGIVSRRGRYLYPTPDILANYLSRKTIELLGIKSLNTLFKSLPENAKLSMVDRLRQLGEDPVTKDLVSAIIEDPSFFFSNQLGLIEPSLLHLFRKLAPTNPKLALQRIAQAIETSSREEILNIEGNNRRELVWMLEELVWWEDCFEIAATLLLRLAWGENETYGNNATEIWARLFQIILGGTEAPFEKRFPILKQALNHPDPIFRQLGLRALSYALQTGSFHRIGGPPQDIGRLPPREWKPATYGELGSIIQSCLAELGKLLEDPDGSVRDAAVSVLKEDGPGLIYKGFAKEWIELAKRLIGSLFEVREKILEVTTLLIPADSGLDEVNRAKLQDLERSLVGDSFSDRLRRVVGKWDFEFETEGTSDRKTLACLAAEGLNDPGQLLKNEFSWLFGGSAPSAFLFGKEAGKIDADLILLDPLVQYWNPQIRNDSFFSGYLAGLSDRLGKDWLEAKLDDWAQDPQKSLLVGLITWRVISTERSAKRLQNLMASCLLRASFLETLIGGFWARGLSPRVVKDLVTGILKDKSQEAIRARIAFLNQYIRNNPETATEMRDLLEAALLEGINLKFRGMEGHHWKSLAELTLKNEPQKLANLCISAALIFDTKKEMIPDEISELLFKAVAEASPKNQTAIFNEILGPAFARSPSLIWRIENPFKKQSLFEKFDVEDIIKWIEEDIEERLLLIANVIKVGDRDLTGLARALLIRWGDRKDVSSGLSARFGTGIWWGPESGWLSEKLHLLEEWGKDPHPNIRRWAGKLAESYRKKIERARIFEEEDH